MEKPTDLNMVEQNKKQDVDKLRRLKQQFLNEKEADLKKRQDKNKVSKNEMNFQGKMRTAIG
jgi:hypothetical protein